VTGPTQSNLVNITYNTNTAPVGAITGLTFSSGDSDVFNYDTNTSRETGYQFNVGTNGQSVAATLGWNANGSLGNLNINDSFNSADTQYCNYAHDDLGRVAKIDCGSVWYNTFDYDPFGNIQKDQDYSIPPTPPVPPSNSFFPTYNTATNQFTLSGVTVTYDSDGDLTYDGINHYSWDADGHAHTLGNVTLTYDALGRMVEQQNGSSYTQIVYNVDGSKLALMNGQNLTKAYVPLPGGANAVYNSSGLAYYEHPDWLGTSRLASSPSRTVLWDGAYAPFGDSYAESPANHTYHNFTGQREDTVQGLDDFLFREYSVGQQGRWISPDPAGLAAVDITNPQTWNRYAYTDNMPCNSLDPMGLDTCTLNIGINNPAGLSNDQITAIQNRIATIFAATQTTTGNSVAVNFNFNGSADYSVAFSGGMISLGILGETTFSNGVLTSTTVFVPPVQYMLLGFGGEGQDNALGTAAAHELWHAISHFGDKQFPAYGSNLTIPQYDSADPTDVLMALLGPVGSGNGNTFSAGQMNVLYAHCKQKHGGGEGGNGAFTDPSPSGLNGWNALWNPGGWGGQGLPGGAGPVPGNCFLGGCSFQ
jgi:RHS repeat-associated protein